MRGHGSRRVVLGAAPESGVVAPASFEVPSQVRQHRQPDDRKVRRQGLAVTSQPGVQESAGRKATELLVMHGIEGVRLDVSAGDHRYVLGSDVGLLGSEATRFEREGSAIANRPHVIQPAHAAVLIDIEEPFGVGGYAGDRAAMQGRERNHAVDL
jgi:hypothetical protein